MTNARPLSPPSSTPPARRASLIGLPAPRAVLDDRRAARLLFLGRERGDAHFRPHRRDSRPLGTWTINARALAARLGLLGARFGCAVLVVVFVVAFLLLALRASAQAAGGVQIAGSGGGGAHDVSFLRVISASMPIFSRATSSTRRPRGRCARCVAGRASDAAPRPAGRRASARRSPARASSIPGRPARRTRRRGSSPGAAPAR